jgi:hypothetical protein
MREAKTFGFNRQKLVPLLDATSPRVCSRCDLWFAARRFERTCDGCVPSETRTKRALKGSHPRRVPIRGKRAGSDGVKVVFSEALGLTFRCPVTDPRAASLECRVLAYELAARERWTKGR